MDEGAQLKGACSCGRNHYIISVPSDPFRSLRVVYDDRAEHSRALSLRVPLSRIHSTTHAFYPDESHSSIRRVFTPYHAPHTKRHFCGLCGTSLSYWSEESPSEAEWIYVNLGSLRSESMETLENAGFLRDMVENNEDEERPVQVTNWPGQRDVVGEGREVTGNPWFEEMIEGSELGNIRRRRGGERSSDGKTVVEYEITEFESGDGDVTATGTGKRKLEARGDEDDVEMRSG